MLRPSRQSGFALVIALSLMAFVLLLLLSITTLVQVESQSAQTQTYSLEAEQAALLSLNIAIGKLQEVAGPDQRITAAADQLSDGANIYTGGLSVPTGQGSWTGVWKSDTASTGTPSYSPKFPNDRTFVGWLVSSANDTTGQLELPTTLDDVEDDVNTGNVSDYVTLATSSNGDAYCQVEKVQVDSLNGGTTAFAFAVEDEGLKADLSWSELSPSNLSAERYQASRLSAAPGPDYRALNGSGASGPFDAITDTDYPLTSDSPDLIAAGILKLSDLAGITSTMSSGADASAWLEDQQADVTWGSRGVIADVKLGGLRRDLSLAFEMDGDADVSTTSFPALFSAQEGEFVGGNDRLASPHVAGGMRGVHERFLYRDTSSSGSLFSSDIANSYTAPQWASVRGPNWWALRDYANLYKRLEGVSGNYSMRARAHYPNASARLQLDSSLPGPDYTLGEMMRAQRSVNGAESGSNVWNAEINADGTYIFRPARSNYAPLLIGSVYYYSLKNVGGNLALVADPLYYFWNPYNRRITADNLAVALLVGIPGTLELEVNKADGSSTVYGPRDFGSYQTRDAGGNNISYMLSGLSMEPGEIIAVSPPSGTSAQRSSLVLGNQFSESTGIVVQEFPINDPGDKMNPTWEAVPISEVVSVNAKFDPNARGIWSGSYRQHTSLPVGPLDANTLSRNEWGDQIQALCFWLNDTDDTPYDIDVDSDGVIITAADLSAKSPFGAVAYLALPADSAAPVEIFSQFNPASVGSNERSFNRRVDPNYTFKARCIAGGLNSIIDEMGFDFPPAIRNAYWGTSFEDFGSTHIPMTEILSSPLLSLAQFSHAALNTKTSEAYHPVGNSMASVMVSPVSPYGKLQDGATTGLVTAADTSWLLNDALFDRYFFSGIAPEYTLSGSYTATGSLRATLTNFFSSDYRSANANPVLRPYLPEGMTVDEILNELDDTTDGEGYLKMSAYSLIDGQFNVNSTSVEAWAALLGANRDLAVSYAGSGSDTADGTPFPAGAAPAFNSLSGNGWSGFSRLDNDQITDLAEAIVKQVKLRGPFMSLSDFVNHRVGEGPLSGVHYMGALQAAIEDSGINSSVQASAGGVTPVYTGGSFGEYFSGASPVGERKTTTGIPGDITQAKLLMPLAPRLSARSDTFSIRAYGERRSLDGSTILGQAACEAVLQRVPEYLDPDTDPSNNEPWDEALANPLPYTASATVSASPLNAINTRFGRRFKIVSFRWLAPEELN
ncbi:hypothetical protein SH580_21410 [Coraliomargarita algicola]|uniref:Type 4 fimbrial biogenesis protein PilX N-terminal domain-containing protein n=1 Tax=Coraliomargarita algicola TaxID=3092156 RepID=A0ABZ0RLK8_9BACT|nr:hypothetical protein [Coraliomargarita sp. J2-16]WPJ95978.1 hypothetical protein SH580_21410 [Coraliomargarita sp. J2-16]